MLASANRHEMWVSQGAPLLTRYASRTIVTLVLLVGGSSACSATKAHARNTNDRETHHRAGRAYAVVGDGVGCDRTCGQARLRGLVRACQALAERIRERSVDTKPPGRPFRATTSRRRPIGRLQSNDGLD
jgi:hypothetical protein